MVALRPCLLLLALTSILSITQTQSNDERKNYIVYMGSLPRDLEATSLTSLHMSMAQRVLGSDFAPDAVTHSYHKSFNGFVVKMTEAEAARMRGLRSVISVFESKNNLLATTRSWDFIGFPEDVPRQTQKEGQGYSESDIVVAVIDTGIWLEHETFSIDDANYPLSEQMKKHWDESRCPKECKCNNKIVGARSISGGKVDDPMCPIDTVGHGTHVASIIAGRGIKGASGPMVSLTEPDKNRRTVRGGVPGARIAVYNVCRWVDEQKQDRKTRKLRCEDADILAAFDQAVADQVDLISVSLAPDSKDIEDCKKDYFCNSIAIGAFHAVERHILTSVAAGNDGPKAYSTTAYAPWLLSVAASTIGRKFFTSVTVQDKDRQHHIFNGVSLNTYDPDVDYTKKLLRACQRPDPPKPTGNILVCDNADKAQKGGLFGTDLGIVLESDEPEDIAVIYATPATVLNKGDFQELELQVKHLAIINKSVVEYLPPHTDPSIASMSSRGPNPITPNILKPDIAAPGVHIIAAWPPCCPISGVAGDERKFKYNVASGTSVACPHATAAAAYVKSFHPDWSPAAIKSALMTTANKMKPENSDGAAEFAYGSGQIHLTRVTNPGLVYNASADDYFNFLCAEGYNKEEIKRLIQITKGECTDDTKKKGRVQNLNLPSFALCVDCNFKEDKVCGVSGSFERAVTNVGQENAIYNYKYDLSDSLKPLQIEVEPDCLSFEKKGDKRTFKLKIGGKLTERDKASASSSWMEKVSGSLTWKQVDSCDKNPTFINGGYEVRSPIVVYNGNGKCKTAASKPIAREGIYQFGYQERREDGSTLVA